jgi:hypothetical protein
MVWIMLAPAFPPAADLMVMLLLFLLVAAAVKVTCRGQQSNQLCELVGGL